MIVQMPAGVQNERLTNDRLADANAAGWHAYTMLQHNGLLVFMLGHHGDAEQKVVMALPDQQFERPINDRLEEERVDGWRPLAMESHNGFLVFLMERRPESGDGS